MENVIYYFGLYLIIIFVRTIKVCKEYKEIHLILQNWREFFDVSLDIAFAASGCLIAILLNVDKNLLPVVFIFSLILIMVTTVIEFIPKKNIKLKFGMNVIIILIIFIATFILYYFYLGNTDSNGVRKVSKYKVIIPYKDRTLIDHLGYGVIGEKEFIYTTYIMNDPKLSEDEIKRKAIENFKKDADLKPAKNTKYEDNSIILIPTTENISIINFEYCQ